MVANRMTANARAVAVFMHFDSGLNYNQIATELGFHPSSIKNCCVRFQSNGTITDRYRSGRPKISTARDDRNLIRLVRQNRKLSSEKLAVAWKLSGNKNASPLTVRSRLQDERYDWKAAAKKPRLSIKQKKDRMAFCKEHKSWGPDKWRSVVFSDEMNIEVDNRKGRVMLRRMAHEKYNDDCILKRTKQGSGSIGIWACMHYSGVKFFKIFDGRLNAVRYIEILEDCLQPQLDFAGGKEHTIFQQDNAPCHRANVCIEWFSEQEINILKWPANSPDLNCIENLWSWLDKQIATEEPRSKDHLIEIVTKHLNNVPIDIVKNLIDSMPRRIIECIKNSGGITSY